VAQRTIGSFLTRERRLLHCQQHGSAKATETEILCQTPAESLKHKIMAQRTIGSFLTQERRSLHCQQHGSAKATETEILCLTPADSSKHNNRDTSNHQQLFDPRKDN
jgi:hypothetical protein